MPEDYKILVLEVAAAIDRDATYLRWLLHNLRVDGTKIVYLSSHRGRMEYASAWLAAAVIELAIALSSSQTSNPGLSKPALARLTYSGTISTICLF